MDAIDGSYHKDMEFNFIINKQSTISGSETMTEVKKKQITILKILSQSLNQKSDRLLNNLGIYCKQWDFEIADRHFRKNFPSLINPKTNKCSLLLSIPKEGTYKFDPPSQRFYDLIAENLHPPSPSLETKENLPPPSETKVSETKILKYFSNPLIHSLEKFEHEKNMILQKLKILSEQILLEMLYIEEEPTNLIQSELALKIITQQLSQLPSEFERNLLLCLADEFKPLKLFSYPLLEDIKQEYQWMTNNLLQYVQTMKTLSGVEIENIQQEKPITYNGLIFPSDFAFCIGKPPVNSQQTSSVLERTNSPETQLMTDELIESIINLLSDQYLIAGWKSLNVVSFNFINTLCKSSIFENKLIDYCLFVLYCPENQSHSQYEVLTANILNFLKYYFSEENHLIYQPRKFLEKYNLQYLEKTPGKLSICDLLVGLLEEKPERCFFEKAKEILEKVVSNPLNFEIVKVEKGQELKERYQILSLDSSQTLLNHIVYEKLLNNVPDLALSGYDFLINKVKESAQKVLATLEETNDRIKTRLNNKEEFVPKDLKDIIMIRKQENIILENILSGFSCILSTWNKSARDDGADQDLQKRIYQQREKELQQFLLRLHENFLNDQQVKNMILHFFEVLKYITLRESLFKNQSMKFRFLKFFKICLYYFVLTKIVNLDTQTPQVTESESTDEALVEMKKTGNLDLDILLKSIPSVYKDILFESFSMDSKEVLNTADWVICQNLPQLVDFTFKKNFLFKKIQNEQQSSYQEFKSISIDRQNLIKSTINEICFSTLQELKRPLKIKFINENGIDSGGLRREFYTIICEELFDPLKGLFLFDQNGICVQPSPASKIIQNRLIYFELSGIILAKAIRQELLVDVTLSKGLLKQIIGEQVSLNDLTETDSELAKSLKWILSSNSVEGLEQPFVYENTFFGKKITKELILNGYEIMVTPETKQDFVEKVSNFKMHNEIKEELKAFLKGFHLILPSNWLSFFTSSELQSLISGDTLINAQELKEYSRYQGYTKDSELILWLWEILQEFSQKDLSSFLFFVSGSLRIRKNNFGICIAKCTYGIQRLPTAATCSWTINIPEYQTKEELKQKLLLAIFEGQQSFQLG